MDECRRSLQRMQPKEGQSDSVTSRNEVALDSSSPEETTGPATPNSPVAEERPLELEGLLGQPSLLEQRARGRVVSPFFEILEEYIPDTRHFHRFGDYYALVKHLMYMQALEKVSKEMWENQIWPWNRREQ